MSRTGCLYVVATPIGNLEDISARAISTLNAVDVIAAEDTRHSGRLLSEFGIDTPMLSLHEHNEEQRSEVLIERLQNGQNVALISDAGTPLISDPGYLLVRRVQQLKLPLSAIPGPCALVAALCVAGLPTDRFVFEGFLPAKAMARIERLERLKEEARTMVFYISRHQTARQLDDFAQVFGGDRLATMAREITKMHETIAHGTLNYLSERWRTSNPSEQKGELVFVVDGAQEVVQDDVEIKRVVSILLNDLSAKQASALTAKICGCGRNQAYKYALELKASQ